MTRHRGYFVDLFVRTMNHVAIGMYEQFGYSVYRRVKEYYHSSGPSGKHDDEDAFGKNTLYIHLLMV
jgi:N-terminal acetyltransferase B complex catalytic subunit